MHVGKLFHMYTHIRQICKECGKSFLKEYHSFRGSRKILSDDGSEFKNSLFAKVATLVWIKHSFSSPYRPQAIACIEASCKFHKKCIRKFTMKGEVDWEEVVNITYTAYNFFPNSQSHESAFFLMFGRDVYIPILTNLFQPTL